MAQYFPTYKAKEDNLINRKLNKKEYREIEEFLYTLNLENGYMQELGEHEEEALDSIMEAIQKAGYEPVKADFFAVP